MRKKYIFLIMAIGFLMVGSYYFFYKNARCNSNSISNIITELSSNKYKGRLVGTQENNSSMIFIEKIFEEKKLDYYKGNSYFIPYNQKISKPEKQKHVLKISNAKGEIKDLVYGKDYIESGLIKNIKIEGYTTFNKNDSNLKDKIIVTDDITNIKDVSGNVKGIFVKENRFKKQLSFASNSIIPTIRINKETYEFLKLNEGAYARYSSNIPEEEYTVYNVVGKYGKGERKKAIVLSAHFDHVGYIDEDIYSGAIDNASGIALMINLGEKIISKIDLNKVDYDIILCAFNGEETDLQGSKALIDILRRDYNNIFNLNIDCIGVKNGGNIVLSTEKDKYPCIVDTFADNLSAHNYSYNITGLNYISDHITFLERGIPSICISQKNLEKIHSIDDNISMIDNSYLEILSEVLCDVILKNDITLLDEHTHKHFENKTALDTANNKLIHDTISKEKEGISFQQYKVIEVDSRKFVIARDFVEFKNVNEINKFYKNIKIPLLIDEYKFESGTIFANDYSSISDEEFCKAQLGKTYVLHRSENNINNISLRYRKTINGKNEVLQINVCKKDDDYLGIESQNDSYFLFKEINGEKNKYILKIDPKSSQILNIQFDINKSKTTYCVYLSKEYDQIIENDGKKIKGFIPNWPSNSIEKSVKYIEDINIEKILSNLLKD